jgi:DNA primase
MVERFRLGYAPANRAWLYGFLKTRGYSEDFLDKSGLFSARYKGIPLFSNRLMFPIADRQGRTVAFSGRAMPGALQSDGKEPPKYINTPELETYKKGQTLFAMDLALAEIRQTKTVYIVEGNMDVIALHQAGISNAVAPLGTAFTDEQAKLLRRWAEKVILVFDSDTAGQNAAYKGIITCRKNGLSCFLLAPDSTEAKDPAEILQKFGADILNKRMKNSIIDFEYLISRGRSLYDVSSPEGKNRALALLFPYLEALDSEIERDDCIAAAADTFGVGRDAVQKDYLRQRRSPKRAAGSQIAFKEDARSQAGGLQRTDNASPNRPVRMNDELFLLTVVSVNPDLYPEFRAALKINEIEDANAKELFIALEECFTQDENGVDDFLARLGSEPLRVFITERGSSPEFRKDSRRLMEDGIKRIRGKRLRRRMDDITAALRRSERHAGEPESSLEELLAEKMMIDAEIRNLEGR